MAAVQLELAVCRHLLASSFWFNLSRVIAILGVVGKSKTRNRQ